jgi:hypothetical protein
MRYLFALDPEIDGLPADAEKLRSVLYGPRALVALRFHVGTGDRYLNMRRRHDFTKAV